jgi:hypothetical protein
MKIEQFVTNGNLSIPSMGFTPDLFFLFGQRELLETQDLAKALNSIVPDALFCGCSTSGEIAGESVNEGSVVVTAVQFNSTKIQPAKISLSEVGFNSLEAGKKLVSQFAKDGLKHVFVITDGLNVNGSELVKGMTSVLSADVSITGGMAGDGSNFSKTVIVEPNGNVTQDSVAAIGFYGDALEIGFGSRGGWVSFGVDRLVTKSDGNVLFEIDGQPALDLYKSFLGEKASDLPASGLLFPLSMRDHEDQVPVVRTILAVSEEEKSLTFAGDIPQGSFVRLMKANNDRLINGAEEAAIAASLPSGHTAELALLVSCVGRKLVLKQMVEEEVESVSEALEHPFITGFYSYGELAPFNHGDPCELHNQTMTITTFREI